MLVENLDLKLTRDLVKSCALLGRSEVRYLVDLYYQMQDYRIRSAGQSRAMVKSSEPNTLVSWSASIFEGMEKQIRRAMKSYSKAHRPGRWAMSVHGIGPIISAGLLAHIDIEKAPYVGNIWSFAGLDPSAKWEKKQKRPWNARLKVLCWKIGGSFVKLRNSENDIYGKVYECRKALEKERNESGAFATQASAVLAAKKIRAPETRAAYESGKLPPGHIEARSRRYAVKLFLAHLHHVMYECHYGEPPPMPYVLTQDGHTRFMGPPNWPIE